MTLIIDRPSIADECKAKKSGHQITNLKCNPFLYFVFIKIAVGQLKEKMKTELWASVKSYINNKQGCINEKVKFGVNSKYQLLGWSITLKAFSQVYYRLIFHYSGMENMKATKITIETPTIFKNPLKSLGFYLELRNYSLSSRLFDRFRVIVERLEPQAELWELNFNSIPFFLIAYDLPSRSMQCKRVNIESRNNTFFCPDLLLFSFTLQYYLQIECINCINLRRIIGKPGLNTLYKLYQTSIFRLFLNISFLGYSQISLIQNMLPFPFLFQFFGDIGQQQNNLIWPYKHRNNFLLIPFPILFHLFSLRE